jgi:hypothetical protein
VGHVQDDSADGVQANGSIGRRSLIKGAAAAGVAAWTAPAILDSLLSPAAAASFTDCRKIHIEGSGCEDLSGSSSAWATSCDGSFPGTVASTCGSGITGVTVAIDALTNLGITRTSCGTFDTTLRLTKTNCSWVAGVAHSTVSGCNDTASMNNATAGSRTMTFDVGSFVDDYYLVVTCT